jgi:hypothetical protein
VRSSRLAPRLGLALLAVSALATAPTRDGLLAQVAYHHEPAVHELIAQTTAGERFPWGPGEPSHGHGTWWQWPPDDPNTTLHREDDIPGGPWFKRTRYPAGLAPGRAPVNWGGWNRGSSQQGEEYSRIYFSQHLRLVDPGTGDWESQQVGTKLGFFGVGRCSGSNAELYLLLQGGTRRDFTLRMMQQGPTSRSLSQNRYNPPVFHVGRWHHLEIEMALNDIGWPNGLLRIWVDGRLIMEHRDVVYRTPTDPCGFLAWKWNPTWGGTGGPDKARDDFIDVSDVRISGVPVR